MSADPPANDCCGVRLVQGARFCSKCGRKLEQAELARAAPKPTPPTLPETISCQGCGAPTPLARLIQPLYDMMRETPEDIAAAHRLPSPAEHALQEGKILLPDVDSVERSLQGRFPNMSQVAQEQFWQASVISDPVLGAFDLAARIVRACARPRGGHRISGLVVQPCAACGRNDPAGIARDVEEARKRVSTRRFE
jgi:hypothetical protein